jgi:hypothetical protein
MNPFNVLRTWAKNSILGGIADAVEEAGAAAGPAIVVKLELPAIAAPVAADDADDKPRTRAKGGAK